MQNLKHVLSYLVWIMLSLLLGIGYIRLLLGNLPTDESIGGLGFILKVFYVHGLTLIGLPIGGIIAVLFIIIDRLYLRKKIKTNPKKTIIRIAVLLVITLFVAMVHYVLEKVIDVI